MSPDEKDLAKHAMEVAFSPARDFFAKLVGGPAEEAGGIVTDLLRVRRLKRAWKLLEDVKQEAEKRGIDPRRVPIKTLLPILEGASLEEDEDEDMHERWKWLLLNAASPNFAGDVSPRFPEVLHQLSPREAKLLDGIYERVLASPELVTDLGYLESNPVMFTREGLQILYKELGLTEEDWPPTWDTSFKDGARDLRRFERELSDLVTLGVLRRDRYRADHAANALQEAGYLLTAFGFEFVTACRNPSRPNDSPQDSQESA